MWADRRLPIIMLHVEQKDVHCVPLSQAVFYEQQQGRICISPFGQSEEPQLVELTRFLDKKKRSGVPYVPLSSTLTPNSCGQLGHRWKENSWELPLPCISSQDGLERKGEHEVGKNVGF